jgi:hypothetical protein
VAAVNDLPFIDEHRGLVAAPAVACGVPSPRTSPALDSPARNSCPGPQAAITSDQPEAACLGIRSSVGCALIIPMIIQTIGLDPSGAVWTDEASNVSSLDPSGAYWVDAEHPARNRKGRVSLSAWYAIVTAIEQRGPFRSWVLPVCCPGSGSRRTPAEE